MKKVMLLFLVTLLLSGCTILGNLDYKKDNETVEDKPTKETAVVMEKPKVGDLPDNTPKEMVLPNKATELPKETESSEGTKTDVEKALELSVKMAKEREERERQEKRLQELEKAEEAARVQRQETQEALKLISVDRVVSLENDVKLLKEEIGRLNRIITDMQLNKN